MIRMIVKRFRCKAAGFLASVMMMGILFPMNGYGAGTDEDFRLVFDAEYYYNQNPDLQAAIGADPARLFEHFKNTGIWEGRSGNGDFNLKAYVYYNQDLLDAYRTDWAAYCRHYEAAGKAEGRCCLPQTEENRIVGTYHTNYDKTLPRAVNIDLAASRINGLVLQPGEMFSFNQAVLPRIPENGYVLAPAIGGMEYGGGICQVSSTLYAAMCHGMIPATERYPHSSPVSYMPEGLDATISEGHKDLKFVNPCDRPVKIQVLLDETGLTAMLLLEEAENPADPVSETAPTSEGIAQGNKTTMEGPGFGSEMPSEGSASGAEPISDGTAPETASASEASVSQQEPVLETPAPETKEN